MRAPTLIVVDMLNDLLQAWAPASKERLIHSINSLAGTMRDYERPVIWTRQEFEPDLRDAFPEMRAKGIRITIKGTPGSEIDCELKVGPSDCVGSYDRDHHDVSLRYMSGKIASLMSNEDIRKSLTRPH
jgi:nicotinamidase-related amidase